MKENEGEKLEGKRNGEEVTQSPSCHPVTLSPGHPVTPSSPHPVTSLRLLEPGLATRVVDFGRPGTRSLGVPVGGAADRTSLSLGNALVGNPPGAPALEISMKGPRLRAEGDLACVVFGAPFEVASDRQKIQVGTTFNLRAGEQFIIGSTPRGMRSYLCVRGGLQVAEILGSRSSLENLPADTVLPCGAGAMGQRFLPPGVFDIWNDVGTLRVLPGLQASWFALEEFFGQEYRVSSAANRMGLRLEGRPLTYPDREMVSEPVCPGVVQVVRDGQCIILGVDGQTIGGYPKIAQVIAADLDRLGQLRPGQKVSFTQVDHAQALTIYREQQEKLANWILRLRITEGVVGAE